jgi:O-acetyl-ADP-ribose deacetylase (regulator of RNase III)
MITFLDSDLFASPAQTLVNAVNTVGVMGKGVALAFKQRYPDMFKAYRARCLEGTLDVGMLHLYRTPDRSILNFPTKKHWRQPSRIEYVEAGLAEFVRRYAEYGIESISFPQLGCGSGGLDWEEQVKPLMERYLQLVPLPIFIHIYQPS